MIKSPGVPQEAPVVAAARERGIAVLGEFETGWRLLGEHEFIAVTGSNGKTTTVELIGHLHREAGLPVNVAGNVGTALTSLPGTLAPGHDGRRRGVLVPARGHAAFAPEAAVLLNLAEDHLDRHGTFDAYRAAKLEIFARQPERGGRRRAARPRRRGPRRLRPPRLLRRRPRRGARRTAPASCGGTSEPLLGGLQLGLRGNHNVQNAMAAAAVALARGVDADAVRAGLRSFRGLPHRLEEVATVDGVLYVNDSKATNVASALVGIDSFPGGVHVILGGRSKGGGFAELVARGRRALPRRVPDRRDGRRAARGARPSRRRPARLRRPRARRRGRERRRGARRRRPALARLPLVRPVRELRAARRPLPGARPGP